MLSYCGNGGACVGLGVIILHSCAAWSIICVTVLCSGGRSEFTEDLPAQHQAAAPHVWPLKGNPRHSDLESTDSN